MKRTFTALFLLAAAVGISASSVWAVEPAGVLKSSELKALIQTAKTPTDHLKLAAYYRAEEAQLQAEVKEHGEMAAIYDKNPASRPIPKGITFGEHCRSLVKYLGESARNAGEMAAMHEAMAKAAI